MYTKRHCFGRRVENVNLSFETFSINISDEFCFIDLGDVRKSLILEFEISGRRTGVLHNSSPAGL